MKFVPFLTATTVAITLSTSAFAAGDTTPSTTNTTKECKDGQVWDKKTKKCIDPERGMLSDDQIYTNARELAYDGQFDHAIDLLQLAQNQNDPRILNYLGFSNRKAGRTEIAMSYYQRALAIDPNYNLARSYMAQGMVADGDIAQAKVQLSEIATRGGAGTWAYVMLENAIATRVTY